MPTVESHNVDVIREQSLCMTTQQRMRQHPACYYCVAFRSSTMRATSARVLTQTTARRTPPVRSTETSGLCMQRSRLDSRSRRGLPEAHGLTLTAAVDGECHTQR